MADIDALIADAEQKLKESGEAISARNSRIQADDQSHIAKLIVWAFVLMMLAVIAMVLFGKWADISEPAKFLLAAISSVMLPVVTLVIGYYFSKK